MNQKRNLLIILFLMFICLGCTSQPVEVIDLNKVLDIFNATMDEFKQTPMEGVSATTGTITPVGMENQNPKYDAMFIQAFAENLNSAKLMSRPLGVGMKSDGALEGFIDPNQNLVRDTGEKQVFTIEFDSERNRLIATDTQNQYRRSSHFRPGGLFMGYFLGSMLGRQRSAGISPSRFSNMKMNSRDYHKAAVNKANRSARARSGSRSFRSGK